MLVAETTNNIVGSTLNPHNRLLTVGGASGGEAALLTLNGSPIGWGSDMAGSIRIPCSFNSLYGLRPSYGRMSATGLATSLPGLPVAASVIGPMCKDLAFLTSITKWFIDCESWRRDFETFDMPWSNEKYEQVRMRTCQSGKRNGTLTFAVVRSDGEVMPHPPVQRAVQTVVDALTQRGYQVIDWNPPSHTPASETFFRILGATAGEVIRKAVRASGEPPIPQIASLFSGTESTSCSTAEFWSLCQSREKFRQEYQEYWDSTKDLTLSGRPVDGVILPVAPHAAPPEGNFKYYGEWN